MPLAVRYVINVYLYIFTLSRMSVQCRPYPCGLITGSLQIQPNKFPVDIQ